MKKMISIMLVLAMVLPCMMFPAYATELPTAGNLSDEEQEIYEDRNEYLQLKSDGKIEVSEDGKMTITSSANVSVSLMESIGDVNKMIDIGLVTYQQNEYICPLEEIAKTDSFIITEDDNADFSHDSAYPITPYAEVCSCTYSPLGLGAMVKRNTQEIRNCFLSMAKINPTQALPAAMGLWVGKVREGGEWDYKVKPGYSPYSKKFCCTYGKNNSKKFYHLTSEYIGNYNYGYTGSILFKLDALKLGSGAAAGFDFDKDSADYPAITEGYNDAKACGEYLN